MTAMQSVHLVDNCFVIRPFGCGFLLCDAGIHLTGTFRIFKDGVQRWQPYYADPEYYLTMNHRTVLNEFASRPFLSCLIIFLTLATSGVAQRLAVQESTMTFTSNAELELITATSDQVQGLIDPVTNKFAFTVEVKSFQGFNSALQREHFNEKYMESEKYPRARFSGKIIEPVDFSENGTHNVRAKGVLDIHGRQQTRIIKSKIRIENGNLYLESVFFVPLVDHDISIPTLVSQKIATEIEVAFKAILSQEEI